jgi:hypothetical protein
MLLNEKAKKYSDIDVKNDHRRPSQDITNHITGNLIPEESLLDAATTTTSNTSSINIINSINQNLPIDEPSNAVLLAGLQDLSVTNAIFGSNISDN